MSGQKGWFRLGVTVPCETCAVDLFAMSPEQYTAAGTWVAALAAVGMLAVVIWTARYAKGQLDEARRTRLAQARPFIVVSADVEQREMLMLSVENVGTVPALNVRVQFDELPHSPITSLDEVAMFNAPVPMMPPGHRYSAYWEQGWRIFNEKKPYEHPMTYRAEVTYEDQAGHEFGPEQYVLDLRVFKGQAVHPKGLPELVKAIEEFRDEHKGWTRRGLFVRAVDEVTRERRSYRPILIGRALRAKDEGGWRGLGLFVAEHFRQRHGLHEREGWRTKPKG